MSHFGNFLEAGDMSALQAVLERKLRGLPNDVEAQKRIFTGDCNDNDFQKYILNGSVLRRILDNKYDLSFPYGSARNVDVDQGATLCGLLHYRGQIMQNIRKDKEQKHSNKDLDKNHSFSKFFKEIRARLLNNLYHRLNNSDSKLQVAYTLACMEFAQFKELEDYVDARQLTHHIRRFAKILQQHSGEYIVVSEHKNNKTRDKVKKYLTTKIEESSWDDVDTTTIDNVKFMFPQAELIFGNTTTPHIATKSAYDDRDFVYQPGDAVVFEMKDSIKHLAKTKPLLRALVQPAPDVIIRGEQMDIMDMNDFGDMDDALGAVDELEIDEVDLEAEAEQVIDDEEVTLFESVDIGNTIIIRDQASTDAMDMDT
ncbi:hypothetical protein EK21DRAFT_112155 [Setomelanomma holmii]|uniref:Uncharacterized protein n=1 Tax=Setomelanomma holmii TaxID=210430 RepID=A0A9P4H9E1_9PLEO|nr:hypothetical protein EK21DRAFT_112155 [Setomelanomma holmii]